jgi:hypothetical protein
MMNSYHNIRVYNFKPSEVHWTTERKLKSVQGSKWQPNCMYTVLPRTVTPHRAPLKRLNDSVVLARGIMDQAIHCTVGKRTVDGVP